MQQKHTQNYLLFANVLELFIKMGNSNIIRSEIRISDLQQGMTVEKNGHLITVSKKHITFDSLFGRYCFQGDGSKEFITRVQFKVPTAYGFRLE